MLGLLAEMRLGQLEPGVITYNTTISASEKGQKWEAVLGLLAEMRQDLLQPHVITYNTTMSASEKEEQWEAVALQCQNVLAVRASCGIGSLWGSSGHVQVASSLGTFAYLNLLTS